MVEGERFLIQSPSPACADEAATARRRPDWIRRKILLSELCDSAVNLILKEGYTSQRVQ